MEENFRSRPKIKEGRELGDWRSEHRDKATQGCLFPTLKTTLPGTDLA